MFSSLEEVQVYLKRNCPKKCPVCESKVKRYRISDANDQDEKYIMCKNKECPWPMNLSQKLKEESPFLDGNPNQSYKPNYNSVESSATTESSVDSSKVRDDLDARGPVPLTRNNSLMNDNIHAVVYDIPNEDEIVLNLDSSLLADFNFVEDDNNCMKKGETGHEFLLDVADGNQEVVLETENLKATFNDGLILSIYLPSFNENTIPRWISMDRIEVSSADLPFLLSLYQEMALEFLKRNYGWVGEIKYKTESAVARTKYPWMVTTLKSMLKMSSIKLLTKELNDSVKPTVKKVKSPKPKVKKVKVKKVKPPKISKPKVLKPVKLKKNVATKNMKSFIRRLINSCVSSAVKQVKEKRKKPVKRRLQEPPLLEINVNPFDLLYERPNLESESRPSRKNINAGFDLTMDHINLEELEQMPGSPVTVEFAEVPRRKRKAKESKLTDFPLLKDATYINMDLLEFDDSFEKDDKNDEDYDFNLDMETFIPDSQRSQKRGLNEMIINDPVDNPWTRVSMFPSTTANFSKKIKFDDEVSNEDILDSVTKSIAANSSLKTYPRAKLTKTCVSDNNKADMVDNSLEPNDTIDSTIEDSQTVELLISSDVETPWSLLTSSDTNSSLSSITAIRQSSSRMRNNKAFGGKKDNVIFHVSKQKLTINPRKEEIKEVYTKNDSKLLLTKLSSHNNNIRPKLDTIKEESCESNGSDRVKFRWNELTVDRLYLTSFKKKLKGLASKWSTKYNTPTEPLVLLKEKQAAAHEAKDKETEAEMDQMIKFYSEIYSKFVYLCEKFSDVRIETMLKYLETYHKCDPQEFKEIVESLVNTEEESDLSKSLISDEEEEEEDGLWQNSTAKCHVINYNEKISLGASSGSGSKLVQFFYNGNGNHISFKPVQVASDKEAEQVMALVTYFAKQLDRKLSKDEPQTKDVISTNVTRAKKELPSDVVKYIKSCFTKEGMRINKIGRRTHNGVKKSQKVIPKVPNIIPYADNDIFVPSTSSSSNHVEVSENNEDLELTSREYFLRSMLPKLNNVEDFEENVKDSKLEPAIDSVLVQQEPVKMMDVEALRRKKESVENEDETFDEIPPEEDFKEVLETEVFGGILPKTIQCKGPRKGCSERVKGSGGRNEILRKKLEDEQILNGVTYLLESKNPNFHDVPNFQKMIKPRIKRKCLKIEDLEEEDDDEDFKVPGVKRSKHEDTRKSLRLQTLQLKKETGEYYDQDQEFVVELKVKREKQEN